MTMEYVQIKFTDEKVTLVHLEPRGDVLHGMYPRVTAGAAEDRRPVEGGRRLEQQARGQILPRQEGRAHPGAGTDLQQFARRRCGVRARSADGRRSLRRGRQTTRVRHLECQLHALAWHDPYHHHRRGRRPDRFTANVTFKEYVVPGEEPPEDTRFVPKTFVPESGTATTVSDWPVGGCRQKIDFVRGPSANSMATCRSVSRRGSSAESASARSRGRRTTGWNAPMRIPS